MQKDFDISYLVVTQNRKDLLDECIESILGQIGCSFELIVVDNGSTDGTRELRSLKDSRVTLVELDRNAGFSEGTNIAYRHASADTVALVNNDVILEPRWSEHALRALRSDVRIGAVATLIRKYKEPDTVDSAGFNLLSCGSCYAWNGSDVSAVSSNHTPFGAVATAALYRRQALAETGLFHPEYHAYYEDTDLAMRLMLHGWKTAYAHEASSLHHGSSTGGHGSSYQRHLLRRNIEYLYWVNMQGSLAFKYLPAHLLYEFACFFNMLFHFQTVSFLKAKMEFLAHLKWIASERAKLQASLSANPLAMPLSDFAGHITGFLNYLSTKQP